MSIVTIFWLGMCGVWVGLLVAQIRAKQRGTFLPQTPAASGNGPSSGESWPSVCVVIPARNEAHQIATCLASVSAQDYPALTEILVVDDRSDDETADVVRRFAEEDSRIRVQVIGSLPEGWLGKSHALWQASSLVKAEWMLFLDADCTLERSALSTAVEEAVRRKVGLLTLWPRNRAGSFWEHLLIPLCAGIIALWYGSDRRTAQNDKGAFVNGQFLLIRREEYVRIDGHRSVRTALIEDIPLGERAKRCGVRCWVASGRDLFSVRMYTNYRSLRDGWARIYIGALRSHLKISASMGWLFWGSLFPFVAAIVLVTQAVSDYSFVTVDPRMATELSWCCGLHLVLIYVVSFRFWGFGGCRRSYLAIYPLTTVVVMGILMRAWWWLMVKRRINWGNTIYRIDRKGTILGRD